MEFDGYVYRSDFGPGVVSFWRQAVGALLAGDLARSGSKHCRRDVPDASLPSGLLPVPGKSLASQAPTAFGQNQKPPARQMLPGSFPRSAWECSP